jgi:hypothetical protein
MYKTSIIIFKNIYIIFFIFLFFLKKIIVFLVGYDQM